MSKNLLRIFVFISTIGVAGGAQAQNAPKLIFPLACTYGTDCWAVNYVDVDPAEDSAKDFKCNAKTYEGHKGTDFALGSVAQMRKGVDVLAAADGTVVRLRDGENDTLKTEAELDEVRRNKRECGNGIIIDHGNGMQSIYCHLKQGSVTVKAKDKVRTGQKIAQIGQSGLTEFPHLHFGITWEGGIIDPYTGAQDIGCGEMQTPLWADTKTIIYHEAAIFDGGFRNVPPDFPAIQRGEDVHPETLSKNASAFVFWSGFYNVEEGDRVTLLILDSKGREFNRRREIIPQTRARQYYYTGRKLGNVQLESGEYKGIATLERRGEPSEAHIVFTKEFSVRITD